MSDKEIKIASVLSNNNYSVVTEVTKINNVEEHELLKKVLNCLTPFYEEDISLSLTSLKSKIDMVEDNALKNNVSINLINKFLVLVSSNSYGDNIIVKMIPNKELKEFSGALIKNEMESELANCVYKERLGDLVGAIKRLEKAQNNLKDCKDQEFVNKELEPLKKSVASKKSKNKEGWKKLKEIKEKYLMQLEDLESPTNTKKVKP